MDIGVLRIESECLPPAPDGLLCHISQGVAVRDMVVASWAFIENLACEVEHGFRGVMIAHPCTGEYAIAVAFFQPGVQYGDSRQQLVGLEQLLASNKIDGEMQHDSGIVTVQLECGAEGIDSFVVAVECIEGEPQPEMPVTFMGVEMNGFFQLDQCFMQPACFVKLVGSFGVSFCIQPVVHGQIVMRFL